MPADVGMEKEESGEGHPAKVCPSEKKKGLNEVEEEEKKTIETDQKQIAVPKNVTFMEHMLESRLDGMWRGVLHDLAKLCKVGVLHDVCEQTATLISNMHNERRSGG